MVISISVVLILAALAALLLKFKALGAAAFAVVFLFGFLTAQTPAAGPINSVIQPIVNAITSIGT